MLFFLFINLLFKQERNLFSQQAGDQKGGKQKEEIKNHGLVDGVGVCLI